MKVTTLEQTISVAQNIVDCLTYCTVSHNMICMPSKDEHTYQEKDFASFKAFLSKYKAKWNSAKQAFFLPFSAQPFVNMIIDDKLAPKPNPLAYFPTPQEIIRTMLAYAEVKKQGDLNGLRILEPHGGGGAILDAISLYKSDNTILHTCELDPMNRASLNGKGYHVQANDFLTYLPDFKYDLILINPPYSVQNDSHAYITHIMHALTMLSPFGRLVAVLPAGFEQGDNKKKSDFRELCYQNAEFDIEVFPGGMFEDTTISTSVILIGGSKLADPTIDQSAQSDYKNIFEQRAHYILVNDRQLKQIEIPKLSKNLSEENIARLIDKLIVTALKDDIRLPRAFSSDYEEIIRYEVECYLEDCEREEMLINNEVVKTESNQVEINLQNSFHDTVDLLLGEIGKVIMSNKTVKIKTTKTRKSETSQFEFCF